MFLVFGEVEFALDEFALTGVGEGKLGVVAADFKDDGALHELLSVLQLIHNLG